MTTVDAVAPVATRTVPRAGWLVVASKEFADHVLSVRFFVLLIVLGLAAGIPLFLATERIHDLASQVSGAQAVFLALFIIGPTDGSIRIHLARGLFRTCRCMRNTPKSTMRCGPFARGA